MAVDVEFGVDPPDVGVHGVGGDAQLLGDGQFLVAAEDTLENIKLAAGQAQRVGDRTPLPIGQDGPGPVPCADAHVDGLA